MRVLVTGGAGFVGKHLVDSLLARGDQVCVADNLSATQWEWPGHLDTAAQLAEIDICDMLELKRVFAEFLPHKVVHLAALPFGNTNAHECETVHSTGTLNVIQCCVENNIERLVFTSSAAVYERGGFSEGDTLGPSSTYGIGKAFAEMWLWKYRKQLSSIILRLSNVYGPVQKTGLIAECCKAHYKKVPVTIHGSGEQIRDYVYVIDVVRAINAALDAKALPSSTTLNISTGVGSTVAQVLGCFPDMEWKHGAGAEGVTRSILDPFRASEALDWRPQMNLRDGIVETLAWWRNR